MVTVALTPLQPQQAIDYFQSKGFLESFAWQDVSAEEHAVSFTVAKVMRRDILVDIRQAVDQALAEGRTLDQFRDDLTPILQAKGWWGKQRMTDPLTGKVRTVQLGSGRRLRTIFNMNMRMPLAAGRWANIQRTKRELPFLRFSCVGGATGDGRNRPEHLAWHGTLLLVDDPWWDTHYPPCAWGCRCTAEQFNQRTLDRRGWTVTEKPIRFAMRQYVNPRTGETTMIEQGISPGFAHNVGKSRLQGLTPRPNGPPPAAAAMATGGTPPIAPTPGPAPLAPEPRAEPLADLSRGADAFLKAFGQAPSEERIFTDVGGEPTPIGPALFLNLSGVRAFMAPAAVLDLPLAAEAILRPDEIRWVSSDAPGPRLVRRYIRRMITPAGQQVDVVVDVTLGGAATWSFRTSSGEALDLDSFRGGVLSWRRPSDS